MNVSLTSVVEEIPKEERRSIKSHECILHGIILRFACILGGKVCGLGMVTIEIYSAFHVKRNRPEGLIKTDEQLIL